MMGQSPLPTRQQEPRGQRARGTFLKRARQAGWRGWMGTIFSKAATSQVGQHGVRLASVLGRTLRQGAVFGTRVRLPHASVIAVLFKLRRGLTANLVAVAGDTWVHSRNLAYFATAYKLLVYLARVAWDTAGLPTVEAAGKPSGGVFSARPSHPLQAAAAAAVASTLVWSRFSHINYQILLYVIARVVVSLGRLVAEKALPASAAPSFPAAYPYLAAAAWAAVMVLFEFRPDLLQGSMRRSMEGLYHFDAPDVTSADFLPSPMWCAVAAFTVAWAWRNGGRAALADAFRVLAGAARP